MWIDISISAALAILTIAMAYLGVHVTLHPAESQRATRWYKIGFSACALSAVTLVVWQGVRAGRSQKDFATQIGSLETNLRDTRQEVANARNDEKSESTRRQQAEKDFATLIQGVSKSTKEGVVSGIKEVSHEQMLLENAISVDLIYQEKQIRIYNHGKNNIFLWGTELDNSQKQIEKDPRMISPSVTNSFGLGETYYYLIGDRLEKLLIQRFGKDGQGSIPLKLFVEDQLHRKTTVKCLLMAVVTNGVVQIHTQNLGIAGGW
jgi:hypothetical protein